MLDELYLTKISLSNREGLEEYLQKLPAIRYLDDLHFHKRVTFFVGENGTGKSTLLEGIAAACGFNPEGGGRNFRFSTNETHSGLYQKLKLTRGWKRERDGFFLRAESFYNVASNIEELDAIIAPAPKISASYGGKSLHHQSHGESFLSLMCHRFGGKGLYLLDEPEAALSPSRLLTMLRRMDELVEADSQFIIATHSPILMAYPDAELYWFGQEGIRAVNYRETEHYQLTRRFLEQPERMLALLLDRQKEEE